MGLYSEQDIDNQAAGKPSVWERLFGRKPVDPSWHAEFRRRLARAGQIRFDGPEVARLHAGSQAILDRAFLNVYGTYPVIRHTVHPASAIVSQVIA